MQKKLSKLERNQDATLHLLTLKEQAIVKAAYDTINKIIEDNVKDANLQGIWTLGTDLEWLVRVE